MYVEEDRITLIPRRLHGIPVNEEDIVDSILTDLDTTPLPTRPAPQPLSNAVKDILPLGVFVIFLCLISIAVQCYLFLNPFTVNITLLAKSQQVSLTGTLQLGRALNPIILSQSQTVPTTGKGHQDAKQATGFITFYNGQLQSVFIPAGTTLTGHSGVAIITDQDANIPAANPPTWGITTVSAHAVTTGSSGNIAAYDINQGCCHGVKAVNPNAFSGGQDERNYQTVAKSDIDNASAPLKATVTQGVSGVLQQQLKTNEALTTPSCTTVTTSDHSVGQEATQVKVTVSETCFAVAYDQDMLQTKVTALLTSQAKTSLGAGYSLLDNPQVSITAATAHNTKVIVSFKAQSTWVYALSGAEQQHIKQIIAGKYTQNALQLLYRLPGIENVSLEFSGFGDDTKVPKDIAHIHLLVLSTIA